MKPEQKLSRDVRAGLTKLQCRVWSTEQGYRAQPGGTRCSPGIPDLIVVHPDTGRFCFVELKAGRGKLTLAQKNFAHHVGQVVPCYVWRSLEDALEWFGEES